MPRTRKPKPTDVPETILDQFAGPARPMSHVRPPEARSTSMRTRPSARWWHPVTFKFPLVSSSTSELFRTRRSRGSRWQQEQ